MATWTTTAGEVGNMLPAFAFVDNPINAITLLTAGATGATVLNNSTFNAGNGGIVEVTYLRAPASVSLTKSGTSPTGGNYNALVLERGGTGVGTLTGIAPVRQFSNIDSTDAWKVLDGNDTLIGDSESDILTGGYGGNDSFDGKGGSDTFMVAALAGAPTHAFTGGGGIDTVVVGANIFDGGLTTLDLRSASFTNVEGLSVGAGLVAHINANQIGTGLLLPTATLAGAGTIHVHLPTAQTVDLRTLTNSGVAVVIDASAGEDTVFGTPGADRIVGNGGRDVLFGHTGGDIFDYDLITDSGKKGPDRDLISDFAPGTDSIDLSTLDANGSKSGDKAFKFIAKKDFHDKAGELRYDKINKSGTVNDVTVIEGDTNGNGKADFRIELTGLISLDKGDFVL